MPELVYILTNLAMPDLIKIGRTKNLAKRVQNLSSHSGVPVAFECYYCCEVKDGEAVEKGLYGGLGDAGSRINPNREFFRFNPERAKMLLEGWAIREVSLDDDTIYDKQASDSLAREKSRQPVFTFSMVDIPLGSKLAFLRDETMVAIVTGDREIEFEGERGSLSKFATYILQRDFARKGTASWGPNFWMFDNETLTDRRARLENGYDKDGSYDKDGGYDEQ